MNPRGEDSRLLQLVLDLIPVGVAIAHDHQSNDLSLNAAGARMLGRQLKSGELPLDTVMATGAALHDVKVQLPRNDGSMLSAYVNASPLFDGAGKIIGAIGVFCETTTEAEARAEQFRELALALADAEARERKRLAQLLHDDFQQLISAAKIRAGILRRGVTGDKLKGDAQQIEQLLETVIAASRTLTNELNPPVLYDAGLTAAIEVLARSFQQRNAIKITTQCDPSAEPEAEQVRVLLYEAVRELLQNIVQHAGARTVSISSGLSAEGQLQMVVTDDGKGFDPARLNVDPSRKTRPFGLIEISERMRWLGGTMEITSDDSGTRVCLVMPGEVRATHKPCEQHADATPFSEPTGPSNLKANSKATILVADDHAIFREGLISLLRQEPLFEVIGEAADGDQAMTLARSLKPDILIVDVSMPQLSGLEVTQQLSREMPKLVIVGLSMHERPTMAAAMRNAGAAAYLTKDASSESLVGVLRSLVCA